MKTVQFLLTVLLFVPLPAIGFANAPTDTIDYWHVYYNEDLIEPLNLITGSTVVEIDPGKVKEGDWISVKYVTDTPCYNCTFVLTVTDEQNRRLRVTQAFQPTQKLSVRLRELIRSMKPGSSKWLDFYHWQQNEKGDTTRKVLVFQIRLTEQN